jgi:hypothetical protein
MKDFVVTKSIYIHAQPASVFAFLANGENWPKFAIHNIFSIHPGEEGNWMIETPHGPGQLRLKTHEAYGIVDHEFIDAQEGRWEVPARIVPAGDGAVVMMTLTKPAPMPESDFHVGMTLLDEEFATLKGLLED